MKHPCVRLRPRFTLRRLLTAVCCAVALPSGALSQDTVGTGSIRGIVVRGDGVPVESLRICVQGSGQCAESGSDGRFAGLDARPGIVRLEVRPGRGPQILAGSVEVRAGQTIEIRLELPEIGTVESSVTVSASEILAPDEVVTSGVLIRNREIANSAGTLQDVSRYVSTLPGVVTGSADFRNDIIVRGGSPLENLFVVDNIEIPNINSFANLASAGGTVSLLDVQLIDDVTFLTGGYPAPYTNRLSSVMQIAQREGSRDGFRAKATVAYAGAGAVLEGPWAKGQGSWVVSARRSFLDFFTDDLGTGGVPVYYSFTGKVVRDFGPRDRIWVTSITGLDEIRLGLTEETGPQDALGAFDIRYSGGRNATGVNWQRIFGARGVGLLGLTYSTAGVDSTVKDLLGNAPFIPGMPVGEALAAGTVTFRQDSTESETAVKYDLTLHAGRKGEYRLGGNSNHSVNNYLTLSPLGYDGPFAAVPDTNPINLRERFNATRNSAYLQATTEVLRRVRLTAGGRFDRYAHFGVSRTRFSPRAGISIAMSDDLSWNTSWGIYHQMPLYLFLAAFDENRLLIPARSDHWVSGLAWTPARNTRVTLEAYSKRYKDYSVATQFPALSFANVGDTFDVRDILYPMTSAGRGRARGVELFIEKKSGGKWFGQANLAYSRARHAGLDGVLRPGAFDRPWVLNAVGGRRLGGKWELGIRAAYLTGRPYTPFDRELSTAQRRGVFELESVNTMRLDDYFALDVRVDRTFTVRDKDLVLYLGVQNVTGRENPTTLLWNRVTNAPEFPGGLERFPLIGLEWTL
ncbi:MAG: TonB-dependent receptor [Bryobacterales bacterium]|nr:TonB-dependent receptor [Bryobacterales bacterium]MDE0295068.1 TonB-dependent receptor [Bryobacterales bacterium]